MTIKMDSHFRMGLGLRLSSVWFFILIGLLHQIPVSFALLDKIPIFGKALATITDPAKLKEKYMKKCGSLCWGDEMENCDSDLICTAGRKIACFPCITKMHLKNPLSITIIVLTVIFGMCLFFVLGYCFGRCIPAPQEEPPPRRRRTRDDSDTDESDEERQRRREKRKSKEKEKEADD